MVIMLNGNRPVDKRETLYSMYYRKKQYYS